MTLRDRTSPLGRDERFSGSGWPLEPDEPLVELVRPLEPGRAIDLVQAGPLSHVPAQEGFGLVVVAGVHLAPEDRGPYFARAVAAVSPGGQLFVSGHHLDSFGRAGPPSSSSGGGR